VSEVRDGLDLDLLTHDVAKFCALLLKRNGYVLEQLHSPLVVGGDAHDELKAIAAGRVTNNHAQHYLGFADT
jgi:predicted nucleotidyltransferase